MIVAKKNWTKQRRIKNAPYKNDCCQKNRSKTVEKKWHLKKTTVAKTNWTKQCKVKNAPYIKMTVAKKIGAVQLKIKNGTL